MLNHKKTCYRILLSGSLLPGGDPLGWSPGYRDGIHYLSIKRVPELVNARPDMFHNTKLTSER